VPLLPFELDARVILPALAILVAVTGVGEGVAIPSGDIALPETTSELESGMVLSTKPPPAERSKLRVWVIP
jgi:beta-lactam-binding protein with PASTA domain